VDATGSEIWMAGAESHVGTELGLEWFESAWVLDCAGEMPKEYRRLAARWESCVFPDIEVRPDPVERLFSIARSFAEGALLEGGPSKLVAICHHGMNRSGLGAALMLRALGMEAEEVLRVVRAGRPGALGNRAYEEIVNEPLGDARFTTQDSRFGGC
jgi:protein-tyrosine phosphatase